ncbi:MAG TPA: MarR family winged helix-turn-helix transcriptional regulator [Gemmatimonadaceae bacterium]|jgi:DNA-binding MarR family transcriptional regulator|nr:MarR family winged helix-turn-helix transcriptional regulator [Gemmatimonadaceae bacterium]
METVQDKCAAGTLRRATRSVARLYDRKLARAGLTSTQFSILRALQLHDGPFPLSRLAAQLVFERTSLYRALEPLRREGLITIEPGAGARSKEAALTRKGHARIAQAQPHWQEAQSEFLGQFGKAAWSSLAASLGEIVDAARAAGDGE